MISSIPPSGRSAAGQGDSSRFGKYVLERRIAVGGSSEVFLARPAHGTQPAPRLVIKRLIPDVLEEPQSVGTFAMEARLHRAARHPNVVEVYEAGSVDGEPYLAMEYVDGVDANRLMRRAQTMHEPVPPEAATLIAHELCGALACVHTAVDDTGRPLAVVHRDVTPSNIYLSLDGDVKLGDFGIARLLTRSSMAPETSPLKGKYAYLSPEQVAGEDFDHRADLFSLAVVLAEMLINEPLFPGSGQLAVLLAIRDCRLDRLHANAARIPEGLMQVLETGLARDPNQRFSTAEHFASALAPFVPQDTATVRRALAERVAAMREPQTDTRTAFGVVRDQARDSVLTLEAVTEPQLARLKVRDAPVQENVSISKLIEWAATGRLGPDDLVDMTGNGFQRLVDIPELERHLPSSTAPTGRLNGPGIPDFVASLDHTTFLDVCARMLVRRETGVLFAERPVQAGDSVRKEIYLAHGRVVHIASSEPSELFGEYLVRRGLLDRAELDLALAVLPRYGGRLGDTLIGLNLVDAVQIFRAIRDQGRDRFVEIFKWGYGRLSFYRGVTPTRIEFPLDLDLVPLMMSGLALVSPDEDVVQAHQAGFRDLLVGVAELPETLKLAAWPPEILKVVGAAGEGRSEEDIVMALTAARLIDIASALRAIDVACAVGLLERRSARGQG